MAARAGEPAWLTGTFVCQTCDAAVRVVRGAKLPRCPNGHQTFDLRIAEPVAGEPKKPARPARRTAR